MAGILVTGIVDGRPGLRDLLARLRRWHVTSLLVSPAAMWLLLAAAGVANRWRLSRQPLRTNHV